MRSEDIRRWIKKDASRSILRKSDATLTRLAAVAPLRPQPYGLPLRGRATLLDSSKKDRNTGVQVPLKI